MRGPHCEDNFGMQVAEASHHLLSLINGKVDLHGRARKTLGTALRVPEVRQLLGEELLREAGCVASAGDAFRHLTATDLAATMRRLQKVFDTQDCQLHNKIVRDNKEASDDGSNTQEHNVYVKDNIGCCDI